MGLNAIYGRNRGDGGAPRGITVGGITLGPNAAKNTNSKNPVAPLGRAGDPTTFANAAPVRTAGMGDSRMGAPVGNAMPTVSNANNPFPQFPSMPLPTPVGNGGANNGTPGSFNASGAAANYLGDTAAGELAQDPARMLANIIRAGTGGEINGTFHQLEPLADVANAFYMLMNGNGQMPTQGNEQWINWLDGFWRDAMTPGKFFDAQTMWQNLTNPTGVLSGFLGQEGVSPTDQAQNFKQLATALVGATQHPLMARAMMNLINTNGTAYGGLSALGQAGDTPYTEFLKNNMAGSLPMGIT